MNPRYWLRQIVFVTGLAVLSTAISACATAQSPVEEMDLPDESATPTVVVTPAATPTPDAVPTPERTPVIVPTATPEPTEPPPAEPELLTFQIVNTFPHDYQAFTQGLEFRDGYLYESTGLHGASSIRRVELETGEVLAIHRLGEGYFGEGLTVLGDRIYQLTFRAGKAFVYDRETFRLLSQFTYEGEGWGMANDGERLIMSDGSNGLFFRDPDTFEVVEELRIYDQRGPVELLNELEWINGEIWANVWMSDNIIVIDPETGIIRAKVDLHGLLQPEDQAGRRVDVLNGIAYDEVNDRIFVTGKLWPVVYEIELIPND